MANVQSRLKAAISEAEKKKKSSESNGSVSVQSRLQSAISAAEKKQQQKAAAQANFTPSDTTREIASGAKANDYEEARREYFNTYGTAYSNRFGGVRGDEAAWAAPIKKFGADKEVDELETTLAHAEDMYEVYSKLYGSPETTREEKAEALDWKNTFAKQIADTNAALPAAKEKQTEATDTYYATFSRKPDFASGVAKGEAMDNPYKPEEIEGSYTYYDLLTQNEKDTLNYLLGTGGDADTYYKYLQNAARNRYGMKVADAIENSDWRGGAIAANAIGTGITNWMEGKLGTFGALTGQEVAENGLNYASPYIKENMGVVGGVLYDTGVTVGNMLPSILLSGAIGGTTGAAVGNLDMGVSAGGNAYQQGLRDGMSRSEALVYGTLIGASEAYLQKAMGGISALGGTSAKLAERLAAIENGFLRFIAQTGASMASEAAEEGLQEILDPLFQRAITDNDASVDWSEVGYSALMGALVGGIFEAPKNAVEAMAAAQTGSTAPQTQRTADTLARTQAAKKVQNLSQEGISAETGTDITATKNADTARPGVPGLEIAEENAKSALETAARRVAQVQNAAAALGQNGSRALSSVYDENTARGYAPEDAVRDFYQVYNAALHGTADSNTTAPDYVRLAAQNAGERDARVSTQAKYFGENAGLMRDGSWKKANLTSRESYALDALGKVTGTQIRFADTIDGGSANASYRGGVITLALDAKNPVMASAVHETVHRVRETSPEAYAALVDFVQENMSEEGMGANLAVRGKVYQTNDTDTLTEELVADAFGQMLEKSDVLDQFATQRRSAAQTIMDALHDLVVKIKRALGSKEVRLSDNQKAAFRDLEGKAREMETLFAKALESAQGKENAANEGGGARYSLNPEFSNRLDAWLRADKKNTPASGRFFIGTTSDALQSIGVSNYKIYWNAAKIAKIMESHPAMTEDVIKSVPNILEHPILVMQSQTVANRITMFGEVMDETGNPVLAALELSPQNKAGEIQDFAVIASAYGKNGAQRLIDQSDILYIDPNKKRTNSWLQLLRLQLPSRVTDYGSLGSVTLVPRDVNGNLSFGEDSEKTAVQIAFEKAANQSNTEERLRTKKYSLKEYTAEEQKQHAVDAISYFGKTYRWNETGYLTQDGTKLDFSGRHEGASGGYRTVDHRDIRNALGDDYGGDDYSGSMVQFMSEGNIRISPESGGIDLSVMPTKDQMIGLSDFISKNRGEVILDIDNENGQTVFSAEYPRGTHANKVLGDIRAYFEDGTMPQVSELAQFYTRESYSKKTREALDEYVKQYGEIPTGEKPHRTVRLPLRTEQDKYVSRTIRTVLEAKATPDEAMPGIDELIAKGEFSYEVYGDEQALNDAREYIGEGWDEARREWFAGVEKGNVSKRNTAVGWLLYDNAVNSGDISLAMDILNAMVEHQRNAAQALQATRILKKLSPETQLYGVQKSVNRLQKELNKRHGKGKTELKINEELAQKFIEAQTEEERTKAMRDIYRDIGRQMPSTFADKFRAWRYLAMLGNARTHGRNVFGNAFFVPVVAAKDLAATGIEGAVYRLSGGKTQRTKSLAINGELLSAAWNDFANVTDMVAGDTKYNDMAGANKYIDEGRRVFKSKLLEKARKGNSAALEAEDAWFSRPHYAFALAQYCAANGITAEQLQRGKALGAAREYAAREARKATYRDTNALSHFLSKRFSETGEYGKAGKAANAVMEGILPFRKTPANILVRGIEYSPLGLLNGVKQAVWDVRQGTKTSAEAIDSISAGLTGTMLLGLGAWAAAEGLIRGHGGDDDDKREFEEMMGHQSYALETPDGKSYTLDWLAPEALPFFIGVNLWEMTQSGKDGLQLKDLLSAIGTVTEPLLEMSCLQSLNDIFESVGYASSNDLSGLTTVLSSAATSYLTQAFPTILGQIERTGETERMTTYTEKDSPFTGDTQYLIGKTSAKLPGLDFQQIPYIDAWGRTESSGGALERGFNNLLNPAYTSTIDTSAMEEELLDLYEVTGESKIFPSRAAKYFNVDGERKDLSAEEYVAYATEKGQTAYRVLTSLTASSAYQQMDNTGKVEAIEKVYDYANAVAKAAVSDYEPDGWIAKAISTGKETGLQTEQYIMLYLAQNGIGSLKDAEGETISNSHSLLVMQMIYNTPGLTDAQRKALFKDFNVSETCQHYNKALVNDKLREMERKAK